MANEANIHGLGVGVELFYVPNKRWSGDSPRGYAVKVLKVGRKWATVCEPFKENSEWSHERIDLETLCADGKGHSSPGRCYFSESEYIDGLEITKAWDAFRRGLPYSAPEGLTVARIQELARELGLSQLAAQRGEQAPTAPPPNSAPSES